MTIHGAVHVPDTSDSGGLSYLVAQNRGALLSVLFLQSIIQ